MIVDDVELRQLVPRVLSVLVGRGADFATAEDATQEALIRAHAAWADESPADPTGWLITVAWRAFLDIARSDAARRNREVRFDTEPPAGTTPSSDDTLHLYFLCAHPDLTSSSAVALTLRAVGGLTTRQIARAYLVPEPTMAQRISRAKRIVGRVGVDRPGDVPTVMRVLYLVFNEGYSGDLDLAAEAIRLTRQLAALVDDPEVDGLLALMLLHHARRRSRTRPDGSIVPSPNRIAASGTPSSSPKGSTSHRPRSHEISSASTRRRRRSPRSTPTHRVSRRPTGSRSSSGTTSCSASPTLRSCGSTVRSPSARPTAHPPDWRHWPTSTNTSRGAKQSPPTSTRRTATSNWRPSCTPEQPLERAQPRRTRPPDTPSSTTQPAPAYAPMKAPRRSAGRTLRRRTPPVGVGIGVSAGRAS